MPVKRAHLRRARKSAGLTQEDVAHRLGVDRSTVWRWEAGVAEPSAWFWPRLAKLLGVTRAELVKLLAVGPVPATPAEPNALLPRARADCVHDPVPAELRDTISSSAEEVDDVNRKQFLASLAATMAAPGMLLSSAGAGRYRCG